MAASNAKAQGRSPKPGYENFSGKSLSVSRPADWAGRRGAWRPLRLGLGRTRFADAVDSSLADTPAGHSVADDSRRAATFGNDIMAAADGARTWQGVRSHRAARSRCRRTGRLVVAGD